MFTEFNLEDLVVLNKEFVGAGQVRLVVDTFGSLVCIVENAVATFTHIALVTDVEITVAAWPSKKRSIICCIINNVVRVFILEYLNDLFLLFLNVFYFKNK